MISFGSLLRLVAKEKGSRLSFGRIKGPDGKRTEVNTVYVYCNKRKVGSIMFRDGAWMVSRYGLSYPDGWWSPHAQKPIQPADPNMFADLEQFFLTDMKRQT